MEGDPESTKEPDYSLSDISDILQPSWVRCPVCSGDEMDRFLLDYGYHFLLPFGIFLWCLVAVIS
jgi:hypothetical protein